MKQKHLVLALAGIFATAGLTACGSDSDSNYTPPAEQPTKPSTDDKKPSTDNKKPSTDDKKPSTDDKKPSTDDKKPSTDDKKPSTDNKPVDEKNNAGDASVGGSFVNNVITGGQQYVRNNTKSKFDLVNNSRNTEEKKDNNANSTVTNFIELQNKKMANIVVGRDTPERDEEAPAYYIGTAEPDTTNAQSLQKLNQKNSDIDAGFGNGNTKNNGLVWSRSQKVLGSTKVTDSVTGHEEGQSTSSRIFGAYYLPDNTNAKNNSHWLPLVDAKGNDKKLSVKTADELKNLPKKIKLDNVQYGRVTANLDPLSAKEKGAVDADHYFQIDPNVANSRIRARDAEDAVSQYFYRGINRTAASALPTSGMYQYAGQALMYGIDNSYHNGNAGDPNSNAIALPDRGGEAVGNFVHATVDMGKRNVVGQVYNVWHRNEGNKTDIDTLVTFNGKIAKNSNAVSGKAELAYKPKAGVSKTGDFQATFYGDKGQEMGGAFNSVARKANEKGSFGKSSWGGVFGAKQITEKQVKPSTDPNNGNRTE